MNRKELDKWWHETNGSGTAKCPKCTSDYVCSWHLARLDDLLELSEQTCADSWKEGFERGWRARKEGSSEQLPLPKETESATPRQTVG